MRITYRENETVDDEVLTRLHEAAFGTAVPGEVIPWSARLQAHSVAWVGAYAEQTLVGFVHACWDGGNHAFVLDAVVAPHLQRRGIGRGLLQRLRARVASSGCEWLHVDYEPHLESFYRSCGFNPTAAGVQRLR